MTDVLGKTFCWASGLTARPSWWHGPWFLQAAHLGAGSGSMLRVDDRRAVICLCPLLHQLHVTDRTKVPSMVIGKRKLPTIDNANAIWLKKVIDPAYYDEEFIRRIWKRNPPAAAPLHEQWMQQLQRNVGMRFPTSEE